MKKITLSFLLISILFLQASEFYYAYDKRVKLTEIKEKRNTTKKIKYYQTTLGKEVGVTDEIIIQCKENVNCLKFLESQGFSNISKLSSILFLVKIAKDENIFTISQKLYEQNEIVLAHPNFIKQRTRR